jgi:predicted phage terminase large subunit-like protein
MDLAVTTDSVKRDKSAFVVAGVDPQHVVQVRNVICERLDILDIVQQIMTLNRIYPMATFIVEKGMLANSILPLLKVAMFEENNFVNLILLPVVGQGDKVKRNSSIRARMRAGGVKFDKSADWFIPFEQECMQFPRAVHDDQVDALSNIGLCLDTLATAPTLEEIEQEQYEEDRRGSFLGDDGRSVYTGY